MKLICLTGSLCAYRAWRVTSVMSDSLRPYGLQSTIFHCPWDSPGKNTECLPCPPPGDLPDPSIEPMYLTSPALMGGLPPGKPTWSIRLFNICGSITKRLPWVIPGANGTSEVGSVVNVFPPMLIYECHHFIRRPMV